MKKNIPNIITIIRIIGATALIFLDIFSLPFFIIYSLCGLSDILDGFLARKLHVESRLGSVLDSISDLFFLGIMAVKIMPTLSRLLAPWNWAIIIIPFVLHMLAYIICAFKFHRFSSLHTYANKIMSMSIFFYPFTFISEIRVVYETYAIVFGLIALYGAIEINIIQLFAFRYSESNKSLLCLIREKRNNSNKEIKEKI